MIFAIKLLYHYVFCLFFSSRLILQLSYFFKNEAIMMRIPQRRCASQLHHTPETGNNKQTFFRKELETIQDYVDILETNPEEIKHVENQWEKNFYKNQLKAALALNHSLIKILGEKEHQIQGLFGEISQLQTRNHIVAEEKTQIFKLNNITNENNPKEANRRMSTPQRQIKQAFEAEKKIMGARYSQEKEQYEKLIDRKQEILKSNKEQNVFLRQKLLSLGESLTSFQLENSRLKKQIKRCKDNENECAKVLSFSPIKLKQDENHEQFLEISFNQMAFTDRDNASDQLTSEFEELKRINGQLEEKNGRLEQQLLSRTKMVYYEELETKYLELKKQFAQKQEQIREYRAIFIGFNLNQENYRKQQENNLILQTEIALLRRKIEDDKLKSSDKPVQVEIIQKSSQLQQVNDRIREQLKMVKEEREQWKNKLERMVKMLMIHQQQWQVYLNTMDLRPFEG